MVQQDYATVDGVKVEKADFGYAPGDEPSNKRKIVSRAGALGVEADAWIPRVQTGGSVGGATQ